MKQKSSLVDCDGLWVQIGDKNAEKRKVLINKITANSLQVFQTAQNLGRRINLGNEIQTLNIKRKNDVRKYAMKKALENWTDARKLFKF